MKAVRVLCRCDRVEDRLLVNVLGERNLHEDAVDRIVCVELVDQLQKRGLARVGGEVVVPRFDPDLGAALAFRSHVDVTRRVVPNEHRSEPRDHTLFGELGAGQSHLAPHLSGYSFPVD